MTDEEGKNKKTKYIIIAVVVVLIAAVICGLMVWMFHSHSSLMKKIGGAMEPKVAAVEGHYSNPYVQHSLS